MQVSLARRAFFKGRLSTGKSVSDVSDLHPPQRPPWTLNEPAFLDACEPCDTCRQACPQGIIMRGDGGYPQVHFDSGECTFCGACVQSCEKGAFVEFAPYATFNTPTTTTLNTPTTTRPWNFTAGINDECLSANGIMCRVCGDRCDVGAIEFELALGGVATPLFNLSTCTGCGACVQPCPTSAITLKETSP